MTTPTVGVGGTGGAATTPSCVAAGTASNNPSRTGVRVLIAATADDLRVALPHSSWQADFAYATDGRQLGYAVRDTGDDLVFVRFPLDAPGHCLTSTLSSSSTPTPDSTTQTRAAAGSSSQPVSPQSPTLPPSSAAAAATGAATSSPGADANFFRALKPPPATIRLIAFSVPRRFLVPAPSCALVGEGSRHSGSATPAADAVAAAAVPANDAAFATERFVLQFRGDKKPILCVVCGQWNVDGQFRQSGYKCTRCVGVASTLRIQALYVALSTHGFATDHVSVPSIATRS